MKPSTNATLANYFWVTSGFISFKVWILVLSTKKLEILKKWVKFLQYVAQAEHSIRLI